MVVTTVPRTRAARAALAVAGALACACQPPLSSSRPPPAELAISRERALELGAQALASRCWSNANWRVVWWERRASWAVWCRMEDDEAYAECSARVDADTGAVTISRLCTSTSW
ncbi:MAG: hypothetical protein H6713_11795 [Myxococcales bacterium]|nr:hypothetical protein [Myxococcales bacterium]